MPNIKLTFLGSGSAFVLGDENYHSNILIESEDSNVLYDAGTTIGDALARQGLSPSDIQGIFASHNHADHTGGLEYIGFKRYFGTFPFGEDIPKLIGHHTVLDELWDNNLKAGMRSLQNATATLDTYFNVEYVPDSGWFHLTDTVRCEIVQTIHVIDDRRFMPSYGLNIRVGADGKQIFITGDSQLAPNQMATFYTKADIIFHDCELAEYPNSVHAQYHELCDLPAEIKEKMWLYHYNLNGGEIELPDAVSDGFKGFVKRGDVFIY